VHGAAGLLAFSTVRILLDYRPALKERTGVGEYAHELAAGLARQLQAGDELVLFTSSWADRPSPDLAAGWALTRVVDRRVPVRLLSYAWHRHGWPPIESLAGPADIVQSLHPLLIPARAARRTVTVHDLDFLHHPERTSAEIRRDYPALVRDHAARAALVVVNSDNTARSVEASLAVPRDRIVVCRPGIPAWIGTPVAHTPPENGYVLFVGTLEPRKNLGTLLDAWVDLASRMPALPRLRVAGGVRPGGEGWVERMQRAPLAGRVEYVGYVAGADRRAMYEGARMLVLPSFHEGFGLPVLEAMALGIPVVTSNRGALPEVAGDAGLLVDAEDRRALADAIQQVLTDRNRAATMSARGVARAAGFSWDVAAKSLYDAYMELMARTGRDAHRR
jgi:glycosyltransferase involved in cell wall biosynthesis